MRPDGAPGAGTLSLSARPAPAPAPSPAPTPTPGSSSSERNGPDPSRPGGTGEDSRIGRWRSEVKSSDLVCACRTERAKSSALRAGPSTCPNCHLLFDTRYSVEGGATNGAAAITAKVSAIRLKPSMGTLSIAGGRGALRRLLSYGKLTKPSPRDATTSPTEAAPARLGSPAPSKEQQLDRTAAGGGGKATKQQSPGTDMYADLRSEKGRGGAADDAASASTLLSSLSSGPGRGANGKPKLTANQDRLRRAQKLLRAQARGTER